MNTTFRSLRRLPHLKTILAGLALIALNTPLSAQPATQRVLAPSLADRLELPIAGPAVPTITESDATKAVAPPRFEVRAPAGAPNVVIILLDDFGFGQSSTFGGPIAMPNIDRLAAQGLRFNRFHTTALCSSTRSALLTGRNAHENNIGSLPELATSFPGNTGTRPLQVTPLAEILRQNGYATAAFGKSHETPSWERGPTGPFARWPTFSGFDKFYGFVGGEDDQYAPVVYDGTIVIDRPKKLDYHFTVDMTDKAIEWARTVQSLNPEKPFFLYYATGATHAPHHVPKEWIDKYKGKFSMGWDKLREETFARQKALGIIPPDAKLTARPKEIPAWDSMTPDQKRILERQMETFAGFADHTDAQIGRLIASLDGMGVLDNTLIFYILGDNGASAEGGPLGTDNERRALNGIVATAEQVLPKVEQWGAPSTYPHYAVAWAWAGNTPFQWTKQVASHFGGTRNGMIVAWPGHIGDPRAVRSQFHHVIDVAPTVLEAAGIPEPKKVSGIAQRPMSGVSMAYTFKDAKAKDRRTTQYFEMFANRAIYDKGWVAAARHSIPWVIESPAAFQEDKWELYNIDKDFSQAEDLAARQPAKLKQLQAAFEREAIRNHVYPIDIRRAERFNASMAGRPDLTAGRKSMVLYPGMKRLWEDVVLNTINARHAVTADIELRADDGEGVIIAQGGRFAGWALYMKDGRAHYEYNYFGDERTKLASPVLGPGKHRVTYEFVPDASKPGSGGAATLSVNGREVARGQMKKTVPFSFQATDGMDVGMDLGTPVSEDYAMGDNAFKGRLNSVRIDLK